MQQQEYQHAEQTPLNNRFINTDPRETSSEAAPHAKLQPQRRRRHPLWLALALCLFALALSTGILGLTGSLSFSHSYKSLPTRAFTINGHGSLVVDDGSGAVHIHKGTTNQVIIQGDEYVFGLVSNFNNTQVQYAQQGNTVTLDVNEGWGILGGSGVDLTITVPANLDVTIHGDSTDADLTNIDGQVNADTSSGDLRLNHINGPLNLNTDSGNVTIVNEQDAVSAHTDSGNIQISQLTGPVNLSADSGNITLDQAQISGQDQMTTDSGNISFTGTLDPHGSYKMTTDSGNITLNLPANSSFQLSTSTDSGDVNNAFSSPTTGSAPHATLTLKTDSGDISLKVQSGPAPR